MTSTRNITPLSLGEPAIPLLGSWSDSSSTKCASISSSASSITERGNDFGAPLSRVFREGIWETELALTHVNSLELYHAAPAHRRGSNSSETKTSLDNLHVVVGTAAERVKLWKEKVCEGLRTAFARKSFTRVVEKEVVVGRKGMELDAMEAEEMRVLVQRL